MKAIDLIEKDPSLPSRVLENAKYFRDEMQALGFKVFPEVSSHQKEKDRFSLLFRF